MTAARCQMMGCRPRVNDTVFDFVIADYEIAGGYCQIQMRATRRDGCASFTHVLVVSSAHRPCRVE